MISQLRASFRVDSCCAFCVVAARVKLFSVLCPTVPVRGCSLCNAIVLCDTKPFMSCKNRFQAITFPIPDPALDPPNPLRL